MICDKSKIFACLMALCLALLLSVHYFVLFKTNSYVAQKSKSEISSFESTTRSITSLSERPGLQEDHYKNLMMVSSWVSFVTLLFLFALLILFVLSYSQSLKKQRESEKLLEIEKITNMQKSKLVALGELAGGVAHEINNPLAIIKGHAEIINLELKKLNHVPLHILKSSNIIVETVGRIAHTVSSLKKLSRGSENSNGYINVTEIIEETLSLTLDRFVREGVSLIKEIPTEDIYVKGNEVDVSQVVISLLNNAIEAVRTLKTKWIKVSLTLDENFAIIDITDNGKGIDVSIRDKIFNPFFTTKEVGQGAGLGLSVSKSIIENLGGGLKLNAQTTDTSFRITLPLYQELHQLQHKRA